MTASTLTPKSFRSMRPVRSDGPGSRRSPTDEPIVGEPVARQRLLIEKECRRELSWLGKPLYVQQREGLPGNEGRREKIGVPVSISANE